MTAVKKRKNFFRKSRPFSEKRTFISVKNKISAIKKDRRNDKMNENQIIDRLKQKDDRALGEIIDRYTPLISAIIYNVSKGSLSSSDIEEATADTFFTLWNNAEKVRQGSLKGYLSAIAKTKALDKLRTVKTPEIIDIDDVTLADEYTISDNMDRQVLHNDICEALNQFGEPDKEILVRYYYYYQTAPKIAEIMELKPEAVKSKIKRARVKLKAFLTERGY